LTDYRNCVSAKLFAGAPAEPAKSVNNTTAVGGGNPDRWLTTAITGSWTANDLVGIGFHRKLRVNETNGRAPEVRPVVYSFPPRPRMSRTVRTCYPDGRPFQRLTRQKRPRANRIVPLKRPTKKSYNKYRTLCKPNGKSIKHARWVGLACFSYLSYYTHTHTRTTWSVTLIVRGQVREFVEIFRSL